MEVKLRQKTKPLNFFSWISFFLFKISSKWNLMTFECDSFLSDVKIIHLSDRDSEDRFIISFMRVIFFLLFSLIESVHSDLRLLLELEFESLHHRTVDFCASLLVWFYLISLWWEAMGPFRSQPKLTDDHQSLMDMDRTSCMSTNIFEVSHFILFKIILCTFAP